jgi:hypothetical protein
MTFSNRNQYSLDDNEKLKSKMQVEQIDMIIHQSLKSFLVFLFSFFLVIIPFYLKQIQMK